MKILFVGNATSVHLQKWLGYFSSQGHEVKIISNIKKEYHGVVIISWLELLEKNYLAYFLSRVPWVGFLVRITVIKNLLKKEKPDLLHIHNIGGTFFSKDFALAGFQPLIVSVWGSDIRKVSKGWSLRRFKTAWSLSKASVITATSNFLAKETKKLVSSDKRVEVVPFGVDTKKFNTKKLEKPRKKDKICIGFIKHLESIYGVEVLLRAFSEINKKSGCTELLLIGGGSQKEYLMRLSDKLGVANKVKFLGKIPNEKVPEYLAEIDVFVMPTIVEESFGVSALEASAMEVPVVASNSGGIPEVVLDGVSGILVKPEDKNALSKAIEKLIRSKQLRKKMGKEGRKFVIENYDWQKNARKMENLYKTILAKHR